MPSVHRWWTRVERIAAPLVAAILVSAAASPARAQCIPPPGEQATEPCEDYAPPDISISPSGGTYTSPSLSVSITWTDQSYTGGPTVTLNGVHVTSQFSTTATTGLFGYRGEANGVVQLQQGSNTLAVTVCDNLGQCGTHTAAYTYGPPGVAVTPDGGAVVVAGGSTASHSFTVQNRGPLAATFTLSVSCTSSGSTSVFAGPCTLSATSVSLGAGALGPVTVSYPAGPAGATGRVHVTATQQDATSATDAGWLDVTAQTSAVPAAPGVTLAGNVGTNVERDLCLIISAAEGAAFECAELRLVHPLPSVRTMNQSRGPVLLYNSQHAHVNPLVSALVTLPAGATVPDGVTAKLYVAGALRATRSFPASDWTPGTSRYIALTAADNSLGTGVHPIAVEVLFQYGSSSHATTASGQMAVVNRRLSMFGSGWWMAGLEHVSVLASDTTARFWVGGDGSSRVYRRVRAGVWGTPSIDRPDTLRLDAAGGGYVRELPHGVRVYFNTQGRHVRTVNRAGHATDFFYSSPYPPYGLRLDSIRVPVPGGQVTAYRFTYGLARTTFGSYYRLTAVHSYGDRDGAPDRVTQFYSATGDGRQTDLTDPDGGRTIFAYDPSALDRIQARTDDRGTTTQFEYDASGRLSRATTPMGEGKTPIVYTYRSAESRAYDRSIPASEPYTLLDGPRLDSDVLDHTYFYLNGYRGTDRVRDARGYQVSLQRGDARFPGLVTGMTAASGLVTRATYDARGNLLTSTVVSPRGDGVAATTRYAYDDPAWPDAVTRIVPPEGDSTVIGYYPNGSRAWQQDAQGTVSRVEFFYNAAGLLSSTRTPSQRAAGGARDSVVYDGYGNLAATRTPLGYWTVQHKDRLGRDTLRVTPIGGTVAGASGNWSAAERREYDLMDRTVLTERIGASLPYWAEDGTTQYAPAKTQWVRSYYNASGQVDSVVRWSVPDAAGLGRMKTSFAYDPVGRPVRETDAAGRTDVMEYDPAGNLVARTDRRGHTVRMSYDAIGRLTERTLPAVSYADSSALGWTFPLFPTCAPRYCIRGDVERFTYDPAGNVLTAVNRDATVKRSYYPNGQLWTDTLVIRTYAELTAGGDTVTHRYGLSFGYDRNGRRRWMKLPHALAPRLPSAPTVAYDSIDYRYDAAGRLERVTDPFGNVFRYGFDANARLDTIAYPLGHFDAFTYDADDRVSQLRYDRNSTGAQSTGTELQYDGRGKVLRSAPLSMYGSVTSCMQQRDYAYDALGMLVASRRECPSVYEIERERFTYDALGTLDGTSSYNRDGHPADAQTVNASTWSTHTHQPGTGRLLQMENRSWAQPVGGTGENYSATETWRTLAQTFDAAGNLTWAATQGDGCNWSYSDFIGGRVCSSHPDVKDGQKNYYGADGRLRASDRRTATASSPFEEFRYDALGRRILRRVRSTGCSQWCDPSNVINRFLWDGNHLLAELQYPGGNGVSAADLERDTVTIRTGDPRAYGRVFYLHGLDLDHPPALIRIGYGANTDGTAATYEGWGPLVVGMGWDWRGYRAGGMSFYAPTSPVKPNGASVQGGSGSGGSTVRVVGPITAAWWGSLTQDQRTETGQLYRRNRYYDPQTNRFTQEDPIGLAGGVNAYGFGDGDPVSYDDPYGLCADGLTTIACIWAAAEVGFTLYDIGDFLYTGVQWLRGRASGRAVLATGVGVGIGIFMVGGGYGRVSRAILRNTEDLAGAASRARAALGPGRGPVYGTRVHAEFAREVQRLGNRNLRTEVSYLNGRVVPHGTRGSVRLDVVQGPLDNPEAVFDLKTGSAALDARRVAQIRSHLPGGGKKVNVVEIR